MNYQLLDPRENERPQDDDEVADSDSDRSEKKNWCRIGKLRTYGEPWDTFIESRLFIYRRPIK